MSKSAIGVTGSCASSILLISAHPHPSTFTNVTLITGLATLVLLNETISIVKLSSDCGTTLRLSTATARNPPLDPVQSERFFPSNSPILYFNVVWTNTSFTRKHTYIIPVLFAVVTRWRMSLGHPIPRIKLAEQTQRDEIKRKEILGESSIDGIRAADAPAKFQLIFLLNICR